MGLLSKILTFHVLGSVALSSDLSVADVETLNGAEAAITTEDGKWFYAGAQITVTDIETTNGVIHVLDAVVLPPVFAPTDAAFAAVDQTELARLLEPANQAELAGILAPYLQ
ncbi:MAG: fasciclin domain-containing protein [Bradymonadaceae bacterium]|nr:fasciclin domain-containing protein [Lujinxingiaceae bacterium]